MNYTPRPGIVRTSLCGMNVLIPSREASDACRSIAPLSLPGTIIWTGIEKDHPMEKVLEIYRMFVKKPDEELIERINAFCETMVERGFALRKEAPNEAPAETPTGEPAEEPAEEAGS